MYGLGAAAPETPGPGGRLNQTVYQGRHKRRDGVSHPRRAHPLFDSLLDRDGGSLLADIPPEYYGVVA